MHSRRLPAFLAVALLVVVVWPTAAPGQDGATITAPDRCYRERTRIPVTGEGFAPNAPVQVGFASRRPVTKTTDADGGFKARVPVPELGDSPRPGRVTLHAIDGSPEASTASTNVQLTAVAVAVNDASLQRRGEKLRFRFSGFPNGRNIWGHYLFGGKERGKQRFGKAKGPCGTLRTRAPLIPKFIGRDGIWTIQFDGRKKYSRKTKPSLRRKIQVFRVPGA